MEEISNHALETFKSLVTLAVEALKFIALINSGSALAIVTYGFSRHSPAGLTTPLAFFLFGMALVAIAWITAYWTQLKLYGETASGIDAGSHDKMLCATAFFAVFAVIAFAGGCVTSLCLLKHEAY